MGLYAEEMIQINARDSGLTYGELFRGQDLSLWNIDRGLSDVTLYAISLSDFNRAMTLQGKAPYSLGEDEFLLNCNYEGTLGYVRTALEQTHKLVIAGTEPEERLRRPARRDLVHDFRREQRPGHSHRSRPGSRKSFQRHERPPGPF